MLLGSGTLTSCAGPSCGSYGILGSQPGALHDPCQTQDPLTQAFQQASSNLGGGSALVTEICQATKAFVQREFGTLGEPGMLTVVADLPLPEAGMTQEDMARNIFSSLAMQGGLVDSDARTQTIMADPNFHPDVKKMLKEMQKKYSGDKGEYEVLVPLLAEMLAKEGAIIFGHKTHNSLIEETVRQK